MRRSIRSLLLILEAALFLSTGVFINLVLDRAGRNAFADFASRRRSEILSIDQLISERMAESSAALETFAALPQLYADSLLADFSDVYYIGDDGAVVRVVKRSGKSAVFEGFDFTAGLTESLNAGRIGYLVSSPFHSTVRRSYVARALEDESPSIYLSIRGAEGLVLARLSLEIFQREISRMVRYDGTAALLVSREGLPLTGLAGKLSLSVLPKNEKVRIGGLDYYVFRGASTSIGEEIALLTPASRVEIFLSPLVPAMRAFLLALGFFMAIRFLILEKLLLSPLVTFIKRIGSWKPGSPAPAPADRIKGYLEIYSLYDAYDRKGKEIEEALEQVRKSEARIRAMNENLERLVEMRTEQLVGAQDQLILAEKMAVLGRVAAGVAHELNTPLGAVASSAAFLSESYGELSSKLSAILERNEPREISLLCLLLRSTGKSTPTRSERHGFAVELTESGVEEAASIADEMRDMGITLTGPKADDLKRRLAETPSARSIVSLIYMVNTIARTADIIQTAADRASLTIRAIKTWTYDEKGETRKVRIRDELETILTLYYNRVKGEVAIEKDFRDAGEVTANAERLNEVWVNLMNNALQAMPEGGRIKLSIWREEGENPLIAVSISDTGTGIPEGVQAMIFTPFFTTKPKGEGTGIGLDLSRRIVEAYGGTIRFRSRPGETVFEVRLPPA